MLQWHNVELNFDDKPDDVSAYLVGTAEPSSGKLAVELNLKFTRGSQSIKVNLKSKVQKVWPEHQAFDIEDDMVADKYAHWIAKFHKLNTNFKSVVLKAAAKAGPGTATWLLSLVDVVKRGN
jgi:hypothetical protein